METTLLSSKGQVIIPKMIRDHHRWRPGTKFVVEDTQAGLLLKPLNLFPPTDIQSGLGCTGYQGPTKSLDEMRNGVDACLRRSWGESEEP